MGKQQHINHLEGLQKPEMDSMRKESSCPGGRKYYKVKNVTNTLQFSWSITFVKGSKN